MRVKMKTLSCGPEGTRLPGVEYPVDDVTGKQLVSGGFAVEIKEEATKNTAEEKKEIASQKIETAIAPAVESAEAPEGRNTARRKR